MSIRCLRKMLQNYAIDTSTFIEKREFVQELCNNIGLQPEACFEADDIMHSKQRNRSFGISLLGERLEFEESILQSNQNTGAKIWCGAEVLAEFLLHQCSSEPHLKRQEEVMKVDLQGKTVVELGCGAGLVGLIAAFVGGPCKVILTDLEDCLSLAKQNVQKHAHQFASRGWLLPQVSKLEWGNLEDIGNLPIGVDFVLAADVIYKPELFHHLLFTLEQICKRSHAKCIIAYKRRHSSEEWFFSQLRQSGFCIAEAAFTNADGVQIFICYLDCMVLQHSNKLQQNDTKTSSKTSIISF